MMQIVVPKIGRISAGHCLTALDFWQNPLRNSSTEFLQIQIPNPLQSTQQELAGPLLGKYLEAVSNLSYLDSPCAQYRDQTESSWLYPVVPLLQAFIYMASFFWTKSRSIVKGSDGDSSICLNIMYHLETLPSLAVLPRVLSIRFYPTKIHLLTLTSIEPYTNLHTYPNDRGIKNGRLKYYGLDGHLGPESAKNDCG